MAERIKLNICFEKIGFNTIIAAVGIPSGLQRITKILPRFVKEMILIHCKSLRIFIGDTINDYFVEKGLTIQLNDLECKFNKKHEFTVSCIISIDDYGKIFNMAKPLLKEKMHGHDMQHFADKLMNSIEKNVTTKQLSYIASDILNMVPDAMVDDICRFLKRKKIIICINNIESTLL